MNRPAIVSVCGDAGGANAIAPVIRLLTTEGRARVVSYAYNEASEILRSHDIATSPLPGSMDSGWITRSLEHKSAALVLTGTSDNGLNYEKQFLLAARSQRVPSLAVLDFWSNYCVRFNDERGDLTCLPDTIAVMDGRARSEMIAAGIPTERIVVTGQPAFDSLAAHRRTFSATQRAAIRAEFGVVEDNQRLVLFASQPLARLYGRDSNDPRYLGYDERKALGLVVEALEGIRRRSGRNITLLIRPHPREQPSEYERFHSPNLRVIVSRAATGRDHALASDVVVGMNTVLLVEACLLGCVVLSVQPGLRGRDTVPTNAWGVSRAVYRDEEVAAALEALVVDETARQELLVKAAALSLDGLSARRVVDVVYTKALC